MASQQTTLCVVNFSGKDIVSTEVSEIDNSDWDGDSRPDHNFNRVAIGNNNSRCEREEINSHSRGCWYKLQVSFADNSSLSFRNDQRDASVKHDRDYTAEGSVIANGQMSLYQMSGGETNGMYIRSVPEPDNSAWMRALLQRKADVRLCEMTMPGSHDAGMYQTFRCSFGVEGEWATNQGRSIFDQLRAGSRYFDFRVYWEGSEQIHRLGHFGGAGGCYGTGLSDALDQIKRFLDGAGAGEVVILKFSHTCMDQSGSGNCFRNRDRVIKDATEIVTRELTRYLYTSNNIAVDISTTRLRDVVGKVVAVFDEEFKSYWNAEKGIIPYRDIQYGENHRKPEGNPPYSGVPEVGNGLRVFDRFSETKSLSDMDKDQRTKLNDWGGWGNDFLFLMSWTLTGGAGLLDIQVLAGMANPWLPRTLAEINSGSLKKPNIIYIDFVDPWICRAIIEVNHTT
jgi:1-phosphatidylinositol phosphodiesterase